MALGIAGYLFRQSCFLGALDRAEPMRIPFILGFFSGFVPAGTHLVFREAVPARPDRAIPTSWRGRIDAASLVIYRA